MRILLVSLCIVVADQVSKLVIKGIEIPFLGVHVQGLPLGTSRPIWGDLLRLTYIENPGMAFGIDIGGKMFFSVFSIVAGIGIVLYLYKVRNENFAFRFALAMVLGGAVGNLVDRVFYGVLFDEGPLFYGKVVDFLDADFFNINVLGYHMSRWPVFNIADASVTCGVLLLMISHRRSARTVLSSPPAAVTAAVEGHGSELFPPSNRPQQSTPQAGSGDPPLS